MKIKQMIILSSMILILFIVIACGFNVSTAKISDAYLAREASGQYEKIDSFAQDEVFICVVELSNAPDSTVTKASWYAVDAEGVDPNYFIDEAEITGGENEVIFDLSNDSLWPAGTYRVDLYLDEELNQSLEFEVK